MSATAGDPTPLVRDVLLRDGSTLRLQAARPADFDGIKAFYEGLSTESRYFRFHGMGRTDTVARAEANATGAARLALLGRLDGQVVAVASYDGLREPRAAEVALAVADARQRRGIGTRMLEQLADIAAECGIRRFDAEVMGDNVRMLGVFERAGYALRRRGSFGEITVSLDITPSDTVIERIDERDHLAAVASWQPILAPATVAVMGAATTPGNLGRAVLTNIVAGGFQGVVEVVNREGGVVCSRRAVAHLSELPERQDLAVIAAAGDELLDYAAEAASGGARALLVVAAGLPDERELAPDRHERLLEIVRGSGLRMVGPGSLGVVNTDPHVSLNATFGSAAVHSGGLGIGSHAAGLGVGHLGHAAARRLGVSVFTSLASRADVSTNDFLEWCEDDPRTTTVVLYVESFGNPAHFTRIAQRVSRHKPILAVKGRQQAEQARRQAGSQTAAALRGDAVVDALMHQAGVLRFHSGEELFDAVELLERQPLPHGREIGIVSNAPGAATLAVDACATRGLKVSETPQRPNPVMLGVGAGPDEYRASIQELLRDPGIDALMVHYIDHHEGDPDGVLEAIEELAQGRRKPLVASVVRSDGRRPSRASPVAPNFVFVESCAAVLARAVQRREWLSRPLGERPHYPDIDAAAARALIDAALAARPEGGWLSLADAEALLGTHGIPVMPARRAATGAQAVQAAREIGGAVALKADFAPPAHASQIDAVLSGLNGASAVRSGWHELERRVRAAGREPTGALVQRLVAPGSDVLVGAYTDPDLGSLVAVGLGGRQAGLGDTTAFRLPPATDAEADELIDSSPAVAAELEGLPGGAPLHRDALRELILRFALLLGEVPEVREADLNSTRCTPDGCYVLDSRVRIEPRRALARVKTW